MSLLSRLLSGSPKTQQSARRSQPRLGVQQLEAREVPAVDFASVLAVGGSSGGSAAWDVAADAAGNSYLTGYIQGTVDFDPSNAHTGDTDILTSRGGTDTFVAKYAPDDSLLWAVRMGSSTVSGLITDTGKAIKIDASGNVYVTGGFTATADFGPVTLTANGGGRDGFVAKLSSTGAVQWATQWGLPESSDPTTSADGERGQSVDTDAYGNVYVSGSRMRASNQPACGYDVLKFSSSGGLVWNKFINTNTLPNSSDMATDPAGNVYLTGGFGGTVDFDPADNKKKEMSGGGAFVLKLTSTGAFGWVSTFNSSYGQSLARDGSGNVFVGGWYSGTPLFSKYAAGYVQTQTSNLPSAGGGFIAKLTSSGGLSWAKAIEKTASGSYVTVHGLATDAAGSVYATGSLTGSVDLNPGSGTLARTSVPDANGSTTIASDAYLLKLTANGAFAWAESFGGSGGDVGWGVAVDPSGTIHFAGSAFGSVDFDPDLIDTYFPTPQGTSTYIFRAKLRQS